MITRQSPMENMTGEDYQRKRDREVISSLRTDRRTCRCFVAAKFLASNHNISKVNQSLAIFTGYRRIPLKRLHNFRPSALKIDTLPIRQLSFAARPADCRPTYLRGTSQLARTGLVWCYRECLVWALLLSQACISRSECAEPQIAYRWVARRLVVWYSRGAR
jgi:hypothetical protein